MSFQPQQTTPFHTPYNNYGGISNYAIPFDATIEEFSSSFPISLVNRVHPEQFGSTLKQCTSIMKQHMTKITESDKRAIWIVLALVATMIFLIVFPTVMVTTVIPTSDSDSWIPAVFIPIVAVLPIIGLLVYSSRRVQQIKDMHLECKKELDALLAQENQMYYQVGVQWILRYEVDSIGKMRFNVYKHLNTIPVLEILINQTVFVVPQQQQQQQLVVQQQPVYVQQEQQPNSVVTYQQQQQVNQYHKENDQQPLLNNRV